MLKKLRTSSRAVSEVLAALIILSLVIAASVIVGVVILNVDVTELSGYFETPAPKQVQINLLVIEYDDRDLDTKYDEITIYLSLDIDSPTIYVSDIDLLLPTGKTLDEISPWVVSSSSQLWNGEYNGFTVAYGTINSSFILQLEDSNINNAEIESGESVYFILRYSYVSQSGARLDVLSSIYQSSLFTFL